MVIVLTFIYAQQKFLSKQCKNIFAVNCPLIFIDEWSFNLSTGFGCEKGHKEKNTIGLFIQFF